MARLTFERLRRIASMLAASRALPSAASGVELWSVGDMAECVFDGPWRCQCGLGPVDPKRGHVAIVRGVVVAPDHTGRYRQYLTFAGGSNDAFDARGFRKLTPAADAAIAADAAFVSRLKRGAVPAPSLIDRLAARLERILS